MEYTKNDLSHNEAQLDLKALRTTSSVALGKSLEAIYHYYSKIQDDSFNGNYTGIYCNSRWLKEEADRLVIVAETHATLMGTNTRENIKLIKEVE